MQWNGEPLRAAGCFNPIPVAPSVPVVLHVVVKNENVSFLHLMKIAPPGNIRRLENNAIHTLVEKSRAPTSRIAFRQAGKPNRLSTFRSGNTGLYADVVILRKEDMKTLVIPALAIALIGCSIETSPPGPVKEKSVRVDRGNTNRANVDLDMAAGELRVRGGAKELVTWTHRATARMLSSKSASRGVFMASAITITCGICS
jgi:hypothetical protein